MGRGKTRGPDPVKDEVSQLEIILAGLDWGKSKLVHRKRDWRHQNVVRRRFHPIGFITDRALGTLMTKRRRNGVDQGRRTSTSAAKWAGRRGRRTPPHIAADSRTRNKMIPGVTRKGNRGWEGGAVMGWMRGRTRHQGGDRRAVMGARRSRGVRKTRGVIGCKQGLGPPCPDPAND